MSGFAVDDVVWVKTGHTHEEPGTILKIDGQDIVIRLHVSNYKLVFGEKDLRRIQEEEEGKDHRRTSRRLRLSIDSSATAQKTSNRSVVTPSPRSQDTSSAVSATEDAQKPAIERNQSKSSPYFNRSRFADNNPSVLEELVAPDDVKASSAPEEAKKTVNRNAATCKSAATSERASTSKKPAAKKPPKAAIALRYDSSDASEGDDSEDGSDDDESKTFQVEYATTGRATCRRCDEVIPLGTVRVSHTPLFRGKPGFRVMRHLQCAIFSDDVEKAQDVGGWKKLDKEDFEALALRVEESKMEVQEENEELSPDELVQLTFQGEMRKPAPALVANLLPFQVEGVSWMYHQEVHVPGIRGGILADEMGMGKTVQTIGTILDNSPLLQHCKPGAKHPPSAPDVAARKREEDLWAASANAWKHEMEMINVSRKVLPKKGAARAGTLVVCPVIALSQWESEIAKFTEPGTLSVGIYHGPKRASEMPAEMVQKYDVVLTTYQVLEQDFRKMVSPNKVTCPGCGGKFKVDKLRVHLKYFCGEGAQRTEAQSRQRRASDHNHSPGGRPSGGSKRGGSKEKPPMTKSKTKTPAAKKRKTVKVRTAAGYDSDSEISLDEDVVVSAPGGCRPCRTAATSASKKLSASVKEWGSNPVGFSVNADDESSFASDTLSKSSGADSDSSEDKMLVDLSKKKGKLNFKKRPASRISSSAREALERARQKQAEALAAANKKGKTSEKKKMPNGKGKGKREAAGKKKMPERKGKVKKFDSSSANESSDGDRDPMEGIDMNELMEEAMAGSRSSLLHSFCWWRIVLDEAHFIKSRSSQTAAAAFSLTAIHRWCLSGTPLQNRVGELYSLIRFLRVEPHAHYFCRQKGCDCKSIHYRMKEGMCQGCGHRAFSHFSHFNRHVLGPIQRDGYSGDGRRAMFKLKNEVLDQCLLRRTKETRAEDMNLPPRIVTIRSVRLHPVEEDFYEALYTQTKSSFDDYVAEGTLLNNYAHIFDLLTKMRQAVDHPYLIVHSKSNAVKLLGQKAAAVANGTVDCEMCHEPPTDRVVSSCCGAGFCRLCVIEYLSGTGGENAPCPSCQAPFSIDLNQASSEDAFDDGTLTLPSSEKESSSAGVPSLKEMSHVATGSILRRIDLAQFATSSKIEVLVQELIEMRTKRPGNKALVFSQFVNMLDLIRWRLHSDPCLAELGLGVRILHGGMDVKSRDAALKHFREDNSCRVLLMSLKAAGVALNLTVASEAYITDLWWNPAAEMQAIDRTHRLGQYKPIRAVRLVAEGTVEERVLQLQEKKRLVFDGTVGRDAGSLKMLTVDDMKALFT